MRGLAPAWRKSREVDCRRRGSAANWSEPKLVVQRTHKTPLSMLSVSVLVADFKNDTGDAVFEGTLEPAFRTALEGASLLVATAAPRHTGLPHNCNLARQCSTNR